MVELVEKTFLLSTPVAIYAVPTLERGTVYMRVDSCNYGTVVIVDSEKFLALWRLSDEPLAQKTRSEWKHDDKIEGAEKRFAAGRRNPVPVIHVLFDKTLKRPGHMQISFSNGFTRTIWLLAHGAAAFPVKCGDNVAHSLQAAAGIKSSNPITIKDLFADLSWEE